jgi:hypothetical protein
VLPGNGGQAPEAEKFEYEKHGEEDVDGGEAKSDEVVLVDIQLVEILIIKGNMRIILIINIAII